MGRGAAPGKDAQPRRRMLQSCIPHSCISLLTKRTGPPPSLLASAVVLGHVGSGDLEWPFVLVLGGGPGPALCFQLPHCHPVTVACGTSQAPRFSGFRSCWFCHLECLQGQCRSALQRSWGGEVSLWCAQGSDSLPPGLSFGVWSEPSIKEPTVCFKGMCLESETRRSQDPVGCRCCDRQSLTPPFPQEQWSHIRSFCMQDSAEWTSQK